MKSLTVRWLIVVNVIIFCGLFVLFLHKHSQQQAERTQFDAVVRQAEENDKTPQSEKTSLHEAFQAIFASKPVTDNQLSLLLTEANKTQPEGTPSLSQELAITALSEIKQPLSPSQKATFCQQLTPVLMTPDITVSSGLTLKQLQELHACNLLAKFDVREAVPQIVPLLNDPKPQIRNNAKRVLQKLGYNA